MVKLAHLHSAIIVTRFSLCQVQKGEVMSKRDVGRGIHPNLKIGGS